MKRQTKTFPRGQKEQRKVQAATSWTVARQAPLSRGFSRQEHGGGFPRPPPGHLPDPGIERGSPESPALAGRFFTTEPPGKTPLTPSLCAHLSLKLIPIKQRVGRQSHTDPWLQRDMVRTHASTSRKVHSLRLPLPHPHHRAISGRRHSKAQALEPQA